MGLATNKPLSIICVDESKVIKNLYQAALSKRGYDVRLCQSADEALEAYSTRPADLIMTELNLAKTDGFELCRTFRQREDSYDVPIMVVSTLKTEEAISRAYSAGADEYLVKPVNIDELLAKTANVISRGQTRKFGGLELSKGALFAGRYQIEDVIGQGGHSIVYAARDIVLDPDRLVVVKVFDIPFYQKREEEYLSLFLREAFEHSKLKHENIIEFIDFGQTNGKYFLVTEYLRGLNLQEMLSERGPLPEENLLFIGFEVSKGLAYLFEQGVVHRDIKPGNIMVTHDAQVKILDFGLAKKMSDVTLTLQDEFMGTPHFVSPEYIRGDRDIDSRTDVYSLGVTLFWAATGGFPIRGDSPLDILEKQLHEDPPMLCDVVAGISPKLSRLIDRMLAKNKSERLDAEAALRSFQNLLFSKERKEAGERHLDWASGIASTDSPAGAMA